MRTLPIVWQRLLSDGQTCDRCAATQRALLSAVATLEAVLAPLAAADLIASTPRAPAQPACCGGAG